MRGRGKTKSVFVVYVLLLNTAYSRIKQAYHTSSRAHFARTDTLVLSEFVSTCHNFMHFLFSRAPDERARAPRVHNGSQPTAARLMSILDQMARRP